jgi:hypothetical protein
MQMTDANLGIRGKRDRMQSSLSWILIGLALGGLAGAALAKRTVNRNAQILCQTLALTQYQNLALLQYKYASPDFARKSMEDLLNFMRQIETSQLAADKETLEFDRSLTYMRLSLIDEKMGDTQAFQRDFAAAAECSRKLGNKETSESHLRDVIARLDAHLP